LFGTIGAIVGARLYFVAFRWEDYAANPISILYIWQGGLAIYGGIIGGLLAAWIVCKVEKLNMYNLLDMVGISLLIGQGIGRWGNYANQEAFGGFTGSKNWGMMSDTVIRYIQRNPDAFGLGSVDNIEQYIRENELYVHPTFFYESVWCILGFFVLFIILKKYRKFSGQLFLSYGVWYGLERMIVEGMRTDSLFIGDTNIRVSQLLSFCLVLFCGTLLTVKLIKYTKNPQPIEGVDYFPPFSEKELEILRKRDERKARNQRMKEMVIEKGRLKSKKYQEKETQEKENQN
ncbi:MAG: prolipoprotein diacylglyceryl transferase, partial [Oscillospiraceae bacterium]|nr:prolipoprotein diacylglyceryl transferase [Oscillospiraceae bacterium]